MIKKALATAAVAASIVGVSGATASQAMAEDGDGTKSITGNGSTQSHGNSATNGKMSPQLGLVQGSLNKPCIGLPVKANVGSLVGLVNVAVQDIPILSSPQTQQCAENSTQAKGDEALSHLLDDIPVLSKNGVAND